VNTIGKAAHSARPLEEAALMDFPIQRIHPLAKLIVTAAFVVFTASFDRYQISALVPMFVFPLLITAFSGLQYTFVFKRLLVILPAILLIGIWNPLFDRQPVLVYGVQMARGWLVFVSLTLKGVLCVWASLLLVATTGINDIAHALRLLRFPKVMVAVLLLTYRYITLFAEGIGRALLAYLLRAPGQKGIHFKAWGSFAGQMLLRAFERAERCHTAMLLRGWSGNFPSLKPNRLRAFDMIYLLACIVLFTVVRVVDISLLLGNWITGLFG